jgi:hypothetical protein
MAVDEDCAPLPSSSVDMPLGEFVDGVPGIDPGNSEGLVVGDSDWSVDGETVGEVVVGEMVVGDSDWSVDGETVGEVVVGETVVGEMVVGDSDWSVDGETVGELVVGGESLGAVDSPLCSVDGLDSGAGVFVGEGVGLLVGKGVSLGVGVGVGIGEGVFSGLVPSLALGRGDSLLGTVAFGGAVDGFGSSTSMSCPLLFSFRDSPVFRMGSAAMVVRRESILGFGWPGMRGRKFLGSFQRPFMITS